MTLYMRVIGYGSRRMMPAIRNYSLYISLDFTFNIKYRPGKANTDTDMLSYLPLNIDKYVEECTEDLSQEQLRSRR